MLGGRGHVRDRTGEQWGRLVVVMRGPNTIRGDVRWLCRCVCGRWAVARGCDLANGNTASCGCLYRETMRENGRRHGYRALSNQTVDREHLAALTRG